MYALNLAWRWWRVRQVSQFSIHVVTAKRSNTFVWFARPLEWVYEQRQKWKEASLSGGEQTSSVFLYNVNRAREWKCARVRQLLAVKNFLGIESRLKMGFQWKREKAKNFLDLQWNTVIWWPKYKRRKYNRNNYYFCRLPSSHSRNISTCNCWTFKIKYIKIQNTVEQYPNFILPAPVERGDEGLHALDLEAVLHICGHHHAQLIEPVAAARAGGYQLEAGNMRIIWNVGFIFYTFLPYRIQRLGMPLQRGPRDQESWKKKDWIELDKVRAHIQRNRYEHNAIITINRKAVA